MASWIKEVYAILPKLMALTIKFKNFYSVKGTIDKANREVTGRKCLLALKRISSN